MSETTRGVIDGRRLFRLIPVILSMGCATTTVRYPGAADALSIAPETLEVLTFVGQVAEVAVEVHNTSNADIAAITSANDELLGVAPSTLIIPAGGSATLSVFVTARDFGVLSAELQVKDRYGAASAALSVRATVQVDLDLDGFGSEATGGLDCDDLDPSVHPDAIEQWYDGVDQDCDEDDDDDQDQDGVSVRHDCDDTDPDRGTPGEEQWNSVDDDCDGTTDDLAALEAADAVVFGDSAGLGLGAEMVADAGGLFLADNEGLSWVQWGASGPLSTQRSALLTHEGDLRLAPRADLLHTGAPDLAMVVDDRRGGALWVIAGDDLTRSGELEDRRSYSLDLSDAGDITALATADLDGDGDDEMLLGAPEWWWGRGAVWISGTSGNDESEYYTGVWGGYNDGELGAQLTTSDVDRDGYEDLLVGAPGNQDRGSSSGAVYFVPGAATLPSGEVDDYARFVVLGDESWVLLGAEPIPVPGDIDGDNIVDLVLGHSASGRVAAWTAPMLGVVALGDLTTVYSERDVGEVVLADLDADHNGTADVLLGLPGNDAVDVVYGRDPWVGVGARILAESGSEFGASMLAAHGVGERGSSLVVGAPGSSIGATGGGAVYVFSGLVPP